MKKVEMVLSVLRRAFRKSSSFCKLGKKSEPTPSPCQGSGGKGGRRLKPQQAPWQLWKRLSLLGVIPAAVALTAVIMFTHKELQRPPFVPYEHLRIRYKRFPWGEGKKSFFHNPRVNPLPDGYEDEVEIEDVSGETDGDAQ